MSIWSILLAGGSGQRMGTQGNKTLISLCGEPALCRALRTLRRHCDGVVLVIRAEDKDDIALALSQSDLTVERWAEGGYDRQESVKNGLAAVPEDCDIVLVHDGARALVDDETIENVISDVRTYGTGVASTLVTDTIKQIHPDETVDSTPNRALLRAVQTPQGFAYSLLARAHQEITHRCTDDAALVAELGVPIHLSRGNARNIKLTTPEDIALAEFYLGAMPRIGHGYDAHRLVEERALILGGVNIPYEKGLLGHSDADVLLHAITDALLGAAALGDIGQHFPDRDPRYKGISSLILLKEAVKLLRAHGFAPLNIDATIIAQRPKLAAFIPQMRQNIADALGVDLSCVSVKATTTEGMGFEGEGAGISTHAVAMIAPLRA